MKWLILLALVAGPKWKLPRGCRDRACAVGRIVSNSGPEPFLLTETYNFARNAQLPPCTAAESCVFQCRVKSDGSSGACYDANGAELSGYTEGVGATFAPTYIQGTYAWLDLDDSSSSTAVPRINSAAIRAMFGGDYTLVFHGYPTTEANANGGWYAMITDGTNQLQARRGSGNLQCLETGSGGTVTDSAPLQLDGFSMWSCTRAGGVLKARTHSVDSDAGVSSTMTTPASGSFFIWGGTGGCCTPGGTAAGQLVSITGYNVAKSAAQQLAIEKAASAATIVQSGPNGQPGTLPATILGRDDVTDSGYVNMFASGMYITDPVLGIRAQHSLRNYWATDPLAAGTWTDVGIPVVTSNASSGPFSRWKNKAECDLITEVSAVAFEGKQSVNSVDGLDGGVGTWVNASCYLKAGTTGITTTAARISFTTDGVIDAGFSACDITGLTSTAARYPLNDGCWAWVDGATSIKANVLVGNAASDTGSITACQCQLTKSLFTESPTVDSTEKGNTWPELDGGRGLGGGMPSGNTKGKLEVVFRLEYSTSQYGASNLANKVFGTYPIDAYTQSASHDVLMWVNNSGNSPSIEALLYGLSGTNENRFNVAPTNLTARTWYVMSMEWRPEPGGCRAKMRFDACADPATCMASTVVGENTGAVGECPLSSDIIDLGTRIAGSNPSTVWVNRLSIYR